MNWDAIGAIGEIIGAIAVLITLVYLAFQVRQSNKLAKMEMHEDSISHYLQNNGNFISNVETARVFREGLLNLDSISPSERIQLWGMLNNIIASFNHIREAYENGIYKKEVFEAWRGYVCGVLAMPGGKIYWNDGRSGYPEDLQVCIEDALDTAPGIDSLNPSYWSVEQPDESAS